MSYTDHTLCYESIAPCWDILYSNCINFKFHSTGSQADDQVAHQVLAHCPDEKYQTDPLVIFTALHPIQCSHAGKHCRVNIEYMLSHLSHSSDIVDTQLHTGVQFLNMQSLIHWNL